MRRGVSLVVAACLAASAVWAAEVQSGLGKGEFVPAFNVTDVTGPAKGTELCYRCRYGDRPVVCIFAKELTPEVAQLTKAMDEVVAKNGDARMAGFLVVLNDSDKAEAALKAAADKHKIGKIPLTTSKEAHGPSGYKLNPSADVTVMMWVDSAVKVSKGLGQADLKKETIEEIGRASCRERV